MNHYNDEINLKDILIKFSEYKDFLLQKKFKIILGSFLFFLIGVGIAMNSDAQYKAELTFVVEEDQSGGKLSGVAGIASQFGFEIGGESSTFSQGNVIELLKSRGVVESTLMQSVKINGKTDLIIEHYLELNNIKEFWRENDDIEGVSFNKPLTYAHDSISRLAFNL